MDAYEDGILISGHALERNADMMFDLMSDGVRNAVFDNKARLNNLITSV